MELRPSPRINRSALSVCERYLNRLPLSLEVRQALLRKLAESRPDDAPAALAELHAIFSDGNEDRDNPACASVNLRLKLAYGSALPDIEQPATGNPDTAEPVLPAAPPINRTPMAPNPWPPRPLAGLIGVVKNCLPSSRLLNRLDGSKVRPDSPDPQGYWHRAGNVRRLVLLGLVLAQTALATYFMTAVLPYRGGQPLEIAILTLFAILCGWVSAGFWTAIMGFLILQFGGDRYAISAGAANDAPIAGKARTAIVMPICNERVARVFAGLSATYASLAKTGNLQHFDFFVLSDSSEPDIRVAEAEAWLEFAAASADSDAFFTAGVSTGSSARAATSPISAVAGAAITATW